MGRISKSLAEEWFASGEAGVPWRRWSALVFVAIGGSLIYGASLGLVLPDWNAVAAALWLALSAGMAWVVLIPVLCRMGKVRLAPCCDACLVTMACGEIVLAAGALGNIILWWSGAMTQAVLMNVLVVGISNVVMAVTLVHRLRVHGVSARRVWTAWMLALNGSGAVFFFAFYQWLHGV
jgi:hypothetical protein